jgi:hypothetical protein
MCSATTTTLAPRTPFWTLIFSLFAQEGSLFHSTDFRAPTFHLNFKLNRLRADRRQAAESAAKLVDALVQLEILESVYFLRHLFRRGLRCRS